MPVGLGSSPEVIEKEPQRLTLDTRAGLASLMQNNTTIDGMIQHQSLQVLRERLPPSASNACEGPLWVRIDYYSESSDFESIFSIGDDFSDLRLGEALRSWANLRDRPCSSPGCETKLAEHSLAFTHNKSKVSMSCVEDSTIRVRRDQGVAVWSECRICGLTTPVGFYSFRWSAREC